MTEVRKKAASRVGGACAAVALIAGCGGNGNLTATSAGLPAYPAALLRTHNVVLAGPVAFEVPGHVVPGAFEPHGPTFVAVWRLNRDPCQPGLRARLKRRGLGRCGTFYVNSLDLVADGFAELVHFPFDLTFEQASTCIGTMFTAQDAGERSITSLRPGDTMSLSLRPLEPGDGRHVPDLGAETSATVVLRSADERLTRRDVRRALTEIGC